MDIHAKLKEIVARHASILAELGTPEATADMDRFTKLNKEYAELTPIVESYTAYATMCENLKQAEEIIADTSADASMIELAEQEYNELKENIPTAEEALKILLLPKDEADSRNIILEIRAGTGGDEAALFVGDVFRMYTYYAQSQGWKVDIQDSAETGVGGYKEIIAKISGENVYQFLKFESGVHRVQRVPATESQGRIHTSAITVAILPEAEELDVNFDPKDIRIDIFRSSGPGGQSVNTTDSAVRVTHIPTGIVAQCQDEKSQHKNKEKALSVLYARLMDSERQKAAKERSDARKDMVGSGDRSERIRTYNYPQSRITDHRINLAVHNLEYVLEGDLNEIITALQQEDQAARLAAYGEDS